MNLDDYQKFAARTINPEQTTKQNLDNYALGLWEAGEVGGLIKKHVYHGHDLDPEKVKGELGDLLWYIAGIATVLKFSLSDVAQSNVTKLRKRYPQGFNSADSIARVDVDQ